MLRTTNRHDDGGNMGGGRRGGRNLVTKVVMAMPSRIPR